MKESVCGGGENERENERQRVAERDKMGGG